MSTHFENLKVFKFVENIIYKMFFKKIKSKYTYGWINLFLKPFQKKNLGLEDFTDKFYQTFKEVIMLIFVSLQVEKEEQFIKLAYPK